MTPTGCETRFIVPPPSLSLRLSATSTVSPPPPPLLDLLFFFYFSLSRMQERFDVFERLDVKLVFVGRAQVDQLGGEILRDASVIEHVHE